MDLNIIYTKFPLLNEAQREMIQALPELYKEWNEKINIVSRKDIDNIVEKHIFHSLLIGLFIRFNSNTKIIDIGTGGGFPGVPLAILFPEAQFTLVDSTRKKLKVVDDIVLQLNIKNIVTIHTRAETIKDKFHFAVSRAALDMKSLVDISKKLIDTKKQINGLPNGVIALKGGELNSELKPFRKIITVENLSDYTDLPYFETKKIIYLPL